MAMLFTISIMITVLPTTGATEHAHLTTTGKGYQQVDHLYTGLQYADLGILFGEQRCRAVDGHHVFLADGTEAIHGATDHVQNASQARFSNGHHDGCTGVLDRHAANEPIGDVHGDGTNHVVPQMLGHLDDQIVFIVVDCRVGDQKGS